MQLKVLTKIEGMISLGCIQMFMFPSSSGHMVGLPTLNRHDYVTCFVNELRAEVCHFKNQCKICRFSVPVVIMDTRHLVPPTAEFLSDREKQRIPANWQCTCSMSKQ